MALNSAKKLAQSTTGNGETTAPLQMRTGTVIAINSAVTPWELTVRISEADHEGVTMMGWYDPRVGDTVQILQQGTMLLVMGTLAPGKIYAPATPPPAPPAPPPPPPAPPVIRTVPVDAISCATAPAEAPYGGVRTDRLYQTGGQIAQRGYWFYGNRIAAAKGSGTIIGASILIRRFNSVHGVGGGANVRLGWHGFETPPAGLENSGPLGGVHVPGTLERDKGGTFPLTQSYLDAMNAGTIKGFGLEPGALGYISPDYLVAYGVGLGTEWSGQLSLTIRG